MAWHHVEDSESVKKLSDHWKGNKRTGFTRTQSHQTIALSTWRCGNCGALAVTEKGQQPACKCGKCGAG